MQSVKPKKKVLKKPQIPKQNDVENDLLLLNIPLKKKDEIWIEPEAVLILELED